MYYLPDKPTHPDAIELWPIIVPLIERLEMISVETAFLHYPRLSSVIYRIAHYLTETMVDAELGILGEIPEYQAEKHAQKIAMKIMRRRVPV